MVACFYKAKRSKGWVNNYPSGRSYGYGGMVQTHENHNDALQEPEFEKELQRRVSARRAFVQPMLMHACGAHFCVAIEH